MMEVPKEEKKFSCKVCEKSFPSYQALGDKRKMKSTCGNDEEPEDLTPEYKVKDVARPLRDLNKKLKELEIDIPECGAEEAGPKFLSLETWLKDRDKIQGTDLASEEEQIEQAAKPESETDVSLTDSTTVYECNTCHRYFGSQQTLADHLAGRTSDGTCPQDIESTAVVPRFNCDGYILRSNVGWATWRRSLF